VHCISHLPTDNNHEGARAEHKRRLLFRSPQTFHNTNIELHAVPEEKLVYLPITKSSNKSGENLFSLSFWINWLGKKKIDQIILIALMAKHNQTSSRSYSSYIALRLFADLLLWVLWKSFK